MGYIKTEEAVEELYRYGFVSRETIAKNIRAIPSIDIVRCKDCKYWVSDGGALMKCDIHKDPTVPDHYCSYGEEDKDE